MKMSISLGFSEVGNSDVFLFLVIFLVVTTFSKGKQKRERKRTFPYKVYQT